MLVGETCNEVDEAKAPSAVALALSITEDDVAFSSALPPMALRVACSVLLCETYHPSPMAPPITYTVVSQRLARTKKA